MTTEAERIRRRLPSQPQLRVWRDYIETAETLRTRLGSRLQSESGISSGDYVVLLTLSEADRQSLRPTEIATRIEWDRTRLSHHLGRMENRGLIRRESCAEDSRGALVVLTAEGLQAFRCSSIPHLEAVRELFLDAFSVEQLAQIDAQTATLRAHLGLPPRH